MWPKGNATQTRAEGDTGYRLRPETVESLFYLHRLTGDRRFRDWGWAIFESSRQHARLPGGAYASVRGVSRNGHASLRADQMDTFWMGETLKYFYLLFSDPDDPDGMPLPLDAWTFNTEAHPLRNAGSYQKTI